MSVLAAACGPSLWICVTLFIVTVQGDDVQQEEAGQAREPQLEDDDFLVGSDADDRFEPLETRRFHEGRTRFFGFRIKPSRQFIIMIIEIFLNIFKTNIEFLSEVSF